MAFFLHRYFSVFLELYHLALDIYVSVELFTISRNCIEVVILLCFVILAFNMIKLLTGN